MKIIILSVIILSAMGLFFGIIIALASKKFYVQVDSRINAIAGLLPGANCGACGFAGCFAFAEALVKGEAFISSCIACSAQNKKEIAALLGLNAEQFCETNKEIAYIACGGGTRCKNKFEYRGLKDCRIAAKALGGYTQCVYACLCQGTCLEACPFGAIKMLPEGIPAVIAELCRGCRRCLAVCPRKLIHMIDRNKKVYVNCASKNKGPETVKVCRAGCIACAKCVNACPVSAISVIENLAVIDCQKCVDCGKCLEVCPTKAIAELWKKNIT